VVGQISVLCSKDCHVIRAEPIGSGHSALFVIDSFPRGFV